MDTINRTADFVAPAPAPESDMNIAALLGTLWRRKGLIVALAVVCLVGAYVVCKMLTPKYTALGGLVIESQRLTVPELQGALAEYQIDSSVVRSEAQILQSRGLLESVAKQLNLRRHREFNPEIDPVPPSPLLPLHPGNWLPKSWLDWMASYNFDLRLPPDYPLTEAMITEYVIWNLGRNLGVLNDRSEERRVGKDDGDRGSAERAK